MGRREIVDAAASGTLLSKTIEETFRLLEEMSSNNYQWPGERSKKATGIHEVDPILSLSAQVSALVNHIASFTTRDTTTRESAMVASSSSYGGDGVRLDTKQCHYVNNKNYNFWPNNNLLTHFYSSLSNHKNFSYANQRNAL